MDTINMADKSSSYNMQIGHGTVTDSLAQSVLITTNLQFYIHL